MAQLVLDLVRQFSRETGLRHLAKFFLKCHPGNQGVNSLLNIAAVTSRFRDHDRWSTCDRHDENGRQDEPEENFHPCTLKISA